MKTGPAHSTSPDPLRWHRLACIWCSQIYLMLCLCGCTSKNQPQQTGSSQSACTLTRAHEVTDFLEMDGKFGAGVRYSGGPVLITLELFHQTMTKDEFRAAQKKRGGGYMVWSKPTEAERTHRLSNFEPLEVKTHYSSQRKATEGSKSKRLPSEGRALWYLPDDWFDQKRRLGFVVDGLNGVRAFHIPPPAQKGGPSSNVSAGNRFQSTWETRTLKPGERVQLAFYAQTPEIDAPVLHRVSCIVMAESLLPFQ